MKEKILEIIADCCPLIDAAAGNFISEQGLDSFDMVTLIAAIEQNFSIKIRSADIIPENFQSVETIAELIQKNTTA